MTKLNNDGELRNRHIPPESDWQALTAVQPLNPCSTTEELCELAARVDSLLEVNDAASLARLAHDLIGYGLDTLDEQEAAA